MVTEGNISPFEFSDRSPLQLYHYLNTLLFHFFKIKETLRLLDTLNDFVMILIEFKIEVCFIRYYFKIIVKICQIS